MGSIAALALAASSILLNRPDIDEALRGAEDNIGVSGPISKISPQEAAEARRQQAASLLAA